MEEILKAIAAILDILFKNLGGTTVLVLIIIVLILSILYKLYKDWEKRNETNLALKSKDESIQILNEQNRQYRIIDLKQRGWSDEDIERFILKETPKNPIEAREMVRGSKRKALKKASKKTGSKEGEDNE